MDERACLDRLARTDMTTVYTDGSCSGNPGPGGWAFCTVCDGEVVWTNSGYDATTTNNRMEMTAAIKALCFVPSACSITICTDSQYLKQGITLWIHNWIKKGWKNSKGESVKNQDLWEELHQQAQGRAITWQWVRAHDCDPHNEMVDMLAKQAVIKAHVVGPQAVGAKHGGR